jgi:hypothetical protein
MRSPIESNRWRTKAEGVVTVRNTLDRIAPILVLLSSAPLSAHAQSANDVFDDCRKSTDTSPNVDHTYLEGFCVGYTAGLQDVGCYLPTNIGWCIP